MVKFLCWDTRGLNDLNKQKEVKLLYSSVGTNLVYFLQIRIKMNNVATIVDNMFGVCSSYSNHDAHYNGRIVIIWWSDWYDLDVKSKIAQAIT